MSNKRQSSGSQSNPRYADYQWGSSNSSAVDRCGESLSTLSLMALPTAMSEPSPYEPRTDYPSYSGALAGSGAPPSHFPGVLEYSHQYPYPQPSESPGMYQMQASPVNRSSMDPGAGFVGSTLVSPSSTPPSRRSTMDGMSGLTQYQVGANRTPERRSSSDGAKRDKKGESRHRRHHQSRASRSDKENNLLMAKGKNAFPYPPVLAEDDLYDPPASSSNGSWSQRDGHRYEEDSGWDMCE